MNYNFQKYIFILFRVVVSIIQLNVDFGILGSYFMSTDSVLGLPGRFIVD